MDILTNWEPDVNWKENAVVGAKRVDTNPQYGYDGYVGLFLRHD